MRPQLFRHGNRLSRIREAVLTLYWVYATALTTDIGDKTRAWFIAEFTQAHFNSAQRMHQELLVLENAPGIVAQHLDAETVLSDNFERWLNNKPFLDDDDDDDASLVTGPIWSVLKLLRMSPETRQRCASLVLQLKNVRAHQDGSNLFGSQRRTLTTAPALFGCSSLPERGTCLLLSTTSTKLGAKKRCSSLPEKMFATSTNQSGKTWSVASA